MRWCLLCAVMMVGACRKPARAPEAEPAAAAPAPPRAQPEPRRGISAERIKRDVEGAEQRHEEQIDKAFDRAAAEGR